MVFVYSSKSVAALNFVGTKATGANIHLTGSTVYGNIDLLNVRSPSTPGLPVGVAHQISRHNALFADFAILTHLTYTSLSAKRLQHRQHTNIAIIAW